MKRISIINIDNLKNFALDKIEKYYTDRGYIVEHNNDLMLSISEAIFVSTLFSWNYNEAASYKVYPNAIIGGTGYDLKVKLPPEIEAIKPRKNYGFTTRGCIRNCDFCIVREKEGPLSVVGDLLDLWDGNAKEIEILDNNPTAIKNHFRLIAKQAHDNKIKLNFHSVDFRTFDDEILDLFKSFRHAELRLAFDNITYKPQVLKAIELLKNNGINQSTWYVLVGFNSSFDEDMERLITLKENGQNAFVQIYNKYANADRPKYTQLARWANQHNFFKKITYEEFLKL